MAHYLAIYLASLLLAPPSAALDVGTVKGSFTIAGQKFTPDNVYGVLAPNANKKSKDVLLIFAIGPRRRNDILADGDGGTGGTDLTVRIGESPFKSHPGLTVISITCDVKGASPQDDKRYLKGVMNSTIFEKRVFDPRKKGRVAGKIHFSEERVDSEDRSLSSDLDFDVPILGEMKD